MGKMINKAVWLSFDLGVGGDYPRLYNWLDNHDAIECGDSLAFFKYSIDSKQEDELVALIKKDLEKSIKIRPGDRVYIIRREVTSSGSSVRGTFLFGNRKGSPWEGYGNKTTEEDE